MENTDDEQIFEAEGALEPGDPCIKHYIWADVSGLYALTLVILGLVTPFVFFSSDTNERNVITVVAFYIYLYLGSFCALGYMHFTVRAYRKRQENQFLAKLEEKRRELRQDRTLSHNDLIIESCKELQADQHEDDDGEFSTGEEGVHFLTRVGAIGFAMASFIMDGLELLSYVWEGSISFDCYGVGFIIVTTCRVLFVYSIATFIFKYHKILIHRNMGLMKFIIGHLLATSLTLWSTTVIMEALESFAHSLHSEHEDASHGDDHNSTAPLNVSSNGHGSGSGHVISALASTAIPVSLQDAVTDVVNATTTAIFHSATHFVAAVQDHGQNSHDSISQNTHQKAPLTSAQCLTQATIGVQAAPYLFPFVIEFSLIAGAAMHHVYRHIQRKEDVKPQVYRDILVDVSGGYECHKSTIGLFFGVFTFAITAVFVAVYVAVIETASLEPYRELLPTQYFGIFAALNITGIIAVIVCFCQMRSHGYSDHLESPLDQNLLLLSLAGYYFMICFQAVAGGVTIVDGEEEYNWYGIIHLTHSLLSFVQITMQTLFIILGFRMRSRSLTHVIRKPGRAAVTFLLVLNMAMWIGNTFMQKMLTQSITMLEFYGSLTWVILFNTFLPLTIFYRFHSAICLAEIWIEAYKLEEEDEHESTHEHHTVMAEPGSRVKTSTRL